MMRPQPMIVLADVRAGSRWFQDVLGLTSGHDTEERRRVHGDGPPEYEMLMDGETMVAQLHLWDAHDHPHMGDEAEPSRGNGVLLWFATDDFEGVLARVEAANAVVLEGPLFNPNARQREIWLRGPEGYRVVVAGPRGE